MKKDKQAKFMLLYKVVAVDPNTGQIMDERVVDKSSIFLREMLTRPDFWQLVDGKFVDHRGWSWHVTPQM